MDGDLTPIESFVKLAKKYTALTYRDEVHAVGLYGHTGAGWLEKIGLQLQWPPCLLLPLLLGRQDQKFRHQ